MPVAGVYLAAAAVQAVFWMLVVIGAIASLTGAPSRLTFAYQFVAMNAAALIGVCRFIGGRVPIMWDTNPLKVGAA
jgi:hypothetical protein